MAADRNAIASHSALDCAVSSPPARYHDLGGSQHVVVERFELRMAPKASGIASRHAHDVRQSGHFGSKMRRHAIRLDIVGINHIESMFRMRTRRNRCELRDERAGRGNMELGTVYGVGPVHRHRPWPICGLATLPVLWPHVHPERRKHLLRIGHNVHFMPLCREGVCRPIRAHADAALNRREFADDADFHGCTSISPQTERSRTSSFNFGVATMAAASAHSSMTESRSKTGLSNSNTRG